MQINSNQNGFTVVELLISMAAFSLMMLVAGLTILQIGKMYYKGVNTVNTEETARTALASVSQAAQFDAGTPANGTGSDYGNLANPNQHIVVSSSCIGLTRFSYVKNRRVTEGVTVDNNARQIRHALWQDQTTDISCPAADLTQDDPSDSTTNPAIKGVSGSGRDLITTNMRLANFDIIPLSGNLVGINIGVIYGDNDVVEEMNPNQATGCLGGVIGAQWCASSTLTTQVSKRTTTE